MRCGIHKYLLTHPSSSKMSFITEPTESLQMIPQSDGQNLCPGPYTDQGLLGDLTGGSTFEVIVGYDQEWPALNDGDEYSRPWYLDHSPVMITELSIGVQFGPQPNLPPFEASFPMLLMQVRTNSIPDSSPRNWRACNHSKRAVPRQTYQHAAQGAAYL